MSKKLYGNGDLIVLRNKSIRGIWITPSEFRTVVSLVGEVGYALYSLLRTYPFKEADEVTDQGLAELTGWGIRKTQKYRAMLEAHNLYQAIRYGTKADGVTKILVGLEPVALFNAGLPADIINTKAHDKLKKELGIETTEDLLSNVQLMVEKYNLNPKDYE